MTRDLASNGEKTHLMPLKNRMEVVKDDEEDPLPGESEEGPPVRVRDVLWGLGAWFHGHSDHEGVSVDVEHYIHDKSLRQRMILLSLSNSKIGIRILFFRFLMKFIGCLLYVAEVTYFDYFAEDEEPYSNNTIINEIHTLVILNGKPWALWVLQMVVAVYCISHILFSVYVSEGGWSFRSLWRIMDFHFFISFSIGGLFLITALYPITLKDLFIPSYLLCWPARQAFSTASIKISQRRFGRIPNIFRIKVINVAITVVCFLFTAVCTIHHFERIDLRISLFDTYWFAMVTLFTVGYGDLSPSHWTGKLLVTIFIVLALVYLLPYFEELYEAFLLQQKLYNSVSYTETGRHIIVCTSILKPLVLRDILTEFYSDPNHYDVHCVLLVENELPSTILLYLSHPVWARRITVLIGTPVRQTDLARARAQSALACFVHTARNQADVDTADQHTILSAWAIKDYAPQCKLYVQILKPENKMYLDVADHVVCEGELKTALLANHSHCPGVATLTTLLLHTFKPENRQLHNEDYQLYNTCAHCEVYHSRLGDSKYFHHFVGKNFLFSAVVAFRKYHVTLIGVKGKHDKHLKLNPGLDHVMEEDDTCYYIGFTKEEYSKVRSRVSRVHTSLWQTCANTAMLSLFIAGIDPAELDEHNEILHYRGKSPVNGGTEEVDFHPPDGDYKSSSERAKFFLPKSDSVVSFSSLSHSTPMEDGGPLSDRHQETRKGLQLLRFHSRVDLHANPVIKVNLIHPTTVPAAPAFCPLPEEELEEEVFCEDKQDFVTFELKKVEEGRLSRRRIGVERQESASKKVPADEAEIPLRRSFSDELMEKTDHFSGLRRERLHSSVGSLHSPTEPQPETLFGWSVLRRASGWSARSAISEKPGEDSPVVLELENIEEEEELEELEDGRCHLMGGDVEGGEFSPPPMTNKPVLGCARPKYEKGSLPVLPHCSCEFSEFHLLPNKRPYSQIRLDQGIPYQNEGQWQHGAVIAYCSEASENLYHFVLPLRAHYIPAVSLQPVVLMLGKEPKTDFLDYIACLPMVYYIVGDLTSTDDWLRAGILLADSVVVIGSHSMHPQDKEDNASSREHMVDATHIMAVQKLAKLFPNLSIITEMHYRYNIRFMKSTPCEIHYMRNLSALSRKGDHLTYLFVPQFAAGKAFCSSMLDTLLYQAHVKPYMIDLVRQLLGCKQVPGSAFLWKVKVTEELLKLQTYDRLFQRLASTHREIPLGIYRTVPISSNPDLEQIMSEISSDDPERVSRFLNSRLQNMGVRNMTPSHTGTYYRSFVLVHPPPKTELKPNDIILVLRPSPSTPNTATVPVNLTNPSQTSSHLSPASVSPSKKDGTCKGGGPCVSPSKKDRTCTLGDTRTDLNHGKGGGPCVSPSKKDRTCTLGDTRTDLNHGKGGGPRVSPSKKDGTCTLTIAVECHNESSV